MIVLPPHSLSALLAPQGVHPSHASLSEQWFLRAVSLGALGPRAGGPELPTEACKEAAASGANPDLRGDQTWR